MAVKHLTCGQCHGGTRFLITIKVEFKCKKPQVASGHLRLHLRKGLEKEGSRLGSATGWAALVTSLGLGGCVAHMKNPSGG